jgi:mRNA-degrading endonuclease RelE of RelBE toxin-antitoxin system
MALMSNLPSIRIQFTDEFKGELRTLAKRYRQIRADIQPLIEQLQAGEFPGDQISGTGYTVFKVRAKNSDIRKGKSAGYRIIYQILSPDSILLLLIYAKSDRTDVSTEEIQNAIKKFLSNQAG